MIADRSVMTVIAPSHSRCSACLDVCRNNPHMKRLLIGHKYDHAANMNSESAKRLLKWGNLALVCRHGKRKDMCFGYFWGRFNMRQSLALAGPPISAKNRGGGGGGGGCAYSGLCAKIKRIR